MLSVLYFEQKIMEYEIPPPNPNNRLRYDSPNESLSDSLPDVTIITNIEHLSTPDYQLFEICQYQQKIQADNEIYQRFKQDGLKVRFPKSNRLIILT